MSKRISFVLVAFVLAAIGLYYRAQSASSAHNQVTQIQNTDTAGGSPGSALTDLKNFANAHMGASVKFTLSASYKRAQAAAQTAAQAQSNASSQLYADAQRACSGHADSITQANCNTSYIQSHLQQINMAPVPQPKLSDYQYSFSSPFWTPDMAGAFFLGAAVSLVFSLFMERSPV